MIPHVPAAHTPYPPRPGNLVTPWVDGVAFYGRLHAVLRAATRCVWGAISFMHRDFRFPDGTPLWDALDACAARGVDVRLLFWRNARFSTAGPTDQPTRNVFHGLPEDLVNFMHDPLAVAAGCRWPGVTVEEIPIRLEWAGDEYLRTIEDAAGRAFRVGVAEMDGPAQLNRLVHVPEFDAP